MTPFQRINGKIWKVQLPPFGESVEFKKNTRHKLESRWERGVFIGVRTESTEKIVGTPQGVFVVQSVRRLPEDQRYNSSDLASIVGLPWKLVPAGEIGPKT